MAHVIHPSFGLVSRVRIGADGLDRIIIRDVPWIRSAVPHMRDSFVETGMAQLNIELLPQEEIARTRAALWAWIVARGMDAPEDKRRDPHTLCALHVGGMGLLLELGWPNVLIIEETERIYHFRRLDGAAAEASQLIESEIRQMIADSFL